MRRTALLLVSLVTLLALGGSSVGIAQSNGIAAKRPVFGGACPACPWGAMADAVKAAMKPYGYDVQICYYCAGSARAARLMAAASEATPPQNPTPDALPTPAGRLDFGATGSELLQYAYLGIHDFAHDKEGPRKNLRLIARIQTPSYFMVAVDAKSGITDLKQIAEKKMPVHLLVRGGIETPINRAFLDYYGLSDEKVKSFGGTTADRYARGTKADVIVGWAALVGAPEYAAWYEASQLQDLVYLDVPADLRASLAKTFYVDEQAAPQGLLKGVTRRIPTVARNGTAVYGRDDMPEAFAYDVAKALDEQKGALQWADMPFSYNPQNVWNNWDVPLHPGAAKYYRERGYMK